METMIDKEDLEIRRHMAKFIVQRMDELGIIEADLARALKSDPRKVNRVVRGENTPSITFTRQLARALQCTTDELCNNAGSLAHS
jgi:ribosome-binding protein aMBF1 (putative translation factor)